MKTPEGEGGLGAGGSDAETGVNADETKQPHALFPFAIVSITYILFTITDGAVRMIVLLHAYGKSFTAMEIAIMFSLYELMGVLTNLIAGIMGARWGIRVTLLVGLCLQIAGLSDLFAWDDKW